MAVEGSSIRSIERITGCHRDSIMRWLNRIGEHCQSLHDEHVRHVQAESVEADEIWTFIGCKEKRVRADHPETWGDSFLFLGSERSSKLIISYLLGDRDDDCTYMFTDDLAMRIDGQTHISTDGWPSYLNAIRKSFDGRAAHAIIVKEFGKSTVDSEHRYSPPRFLKMKRKRGSGRVRRHLMTTSHAERLNLSVRTALRRYTRLSLGFSKKRDNLEAAVSLFVMWHNFCRPHRALGGLTPAQMASLSSERWEIDRLIPQWPNRAN